MLGNIIKAGEDNMLDCNTPCSSCNGTGFRGLVSCPACSQTGVAVTKEELRRASLLSLRDALCEELSRLQPDFSIKLKPMAAAMNLAKEDITSLIEELTPAETN